MRVTHRPPSLTHSLYLLLPFLSLFLSLSLFLFLPVFLSALCSLSLLSLASQFHILLTTYEVVLADVEHLADIRWRYVVVDEAHRLKNRARTCLTLLPLSLSLLLSLLLSPSITPRFL